MHYTFIICIRHYVGVINIKKYYIYHIFCVNYTNILHVLLSFKKH